MKQIYLFILGLSVLFISSCTSTVYICDGPTASAYHTRRNCIGLTNCSGDISSVSLEEAHDMGRHLCHYCEEGLDEFE